MSKSNLKSLTKDDVRATYVFSDEKVVVVTTSGKKIEATKAEVDALMGAGPKKAEPAQPEDAVVAELFDIPAVPEEDPDAEIIAQLTKVGIGYYEIPNGEKVHGLKKAIAATKAYIEAEVAEAKLAAEEDVLEMGEDPSGEG